MASAESRTERVPVTTYKEEVVGVTLRLSQEEAQTLRDICYHVGGDPYKSRRKYISAITNSLDDIGFEPMSRFDENSDIVPGSSIYFKDSPK